ncbi:hypothetical protein KFK09_021111 [Dendrobium nobile]|uniref:F-box domain-containing protein n=1 Tax=Dendrobium nobile TaxID=94219 RepID=A0A8T3ANI3_DENNO|nr:hypothetical protein KFK09_021111 [Dendrobium nobile]
MEGHAQKQRRFHGEDQVNGEDRISVLPDSLIHHILSFLPADVIMKTSLLSQRWKDLWTSVHSLDFSGAISMEEEYFMFRFLCNYLTNYKGSKLFKFRANFYYKEAKDLFVDFLLFFVKMHSIEELDLHLSARFWDYFNGRNLKNYTVKLQSCLFDCRELRVLRLSCFDLKEHACISFRYLKVLDLRLANFEYLDISGCPLLEDLRLVDCNFMSTLNLHAPNTKLRNLKIVDSNTEWGEGGRIIRAPHVLFIDITGDLRPSYDMKDLSSVIRVRLDFSEMLDIVQSPESYDAFMMLMNLIVNVSHAKTLKLCRSCITVLSYVKELKWDIPHFATSCLEVESIFNERELVGLANILGSAPCLEFLTLNIGYLSSWCSWKKYKNYPRSETWELVEIVLPTFLCTVKTITINNLFRNMHISNGIESANTVDEILEVIDEEIKLVKYLLKISNMLKKMVIIISHETTLLYSTSDFLTSITRKLLHLPRTSLNAEINVSYGKPQQV